jgi:phage-related minor tail protein
VAQSTTIQGKLRITGDVADAIAKLRELKKELGEQKKALAEAKKAAAAPAGGAGSGGDGTSGGSGTGGANEPGRRKRLSQEEIDELKRKQEETRRLRAETNLLKQANRQLPAQITDIVTSLASGQPAYLVAIQQGGQLRDAYNGIGPALRAMLGLLTPVRVAIGGVALGFVGFVAGMVSGYRESSQLRKELALLGAQSGITLGQIDQAARGISAAQSSSIGAVRDILREVLTLSGQTDQTFAATGRAASALARLTGQSAEDVVKKFADQAEGITDWSVKANKAYGFLSAAQVDYIRSLERQGRAAEAVKFVNEELAKTLEQRQAKAIGLVERAWNAAGAAASRFWDQIKAIGRDESAEERIERFSKKLLELDTRLAQRNAGGLQGGRRRSTDTAERAAIKAELDQANRDLVRAAEATIAQRAEQKKIDEETFEFRKLKADQEAATARRELAATEQGLAARQAVVEQAYAKEIISAEQRALRLNAIEVARAEAQESVLRREREGLAALENARNKPEEKRQLDLAVTELDTRLTEARTRVKQALAEGRQLLQAELNRLDEDYRQRRAEIAKADIPKTVADPRERASQTAQAETDRQRKEIADLQRQLQSEIDAAGAPQAIEKLRRQLDAARTQFEESIRQSTNASLLAQAAEQLDELAQREEKVRLAVERRETTSTDAETRIFSLRQQSIEQLQAIERELAKTAQTPAEQNQLRQLRNRIAVLKDMRSEIELLATSSAQQEVTNFLNDWTSGVKSFGDAGRDALRSFAQTLQQFLNSKLAEEFLAFVAGSNGSSQGSWIKSLLNLFSGTLVHSGGVIGAGVNRMSRTVSPLVFAGAQVLHNGGMAGLRSNEVPAILERGEEVLTADDPRHRNNLRAGGVQVSMSVSFNGAGGTEADQRASAKDLQTMMQATVEQWAAKESRQGGLLSGVRRG